MTAINAAAPNRETLAVQQNRVYILQVMLAAFFLWGFILMPVPARAQAEEIIYTPTNVAIRLSSMLYDPDRGARAGLVNDDTGQWRMLSAGQTFSGYLLTEANYEEEYAIFRKDGELIRLTLSGAERISAFDADTGQTSINGIPVKLGQVRTRYRPTYEEEQANIDPNDAATWPADYRGPEIERLAASLAERPAPMEQPETPVFEPTVDEINRGIDPNNPDTWPDDYRGPGIERAAAQVDDASMNTPMIVPQPKPGGTPEEIKQRFFELYGPGAQAPNPMDSE